jgi:trehalose-phosphatase
LDRAMGYLLKEALIDIRNRVAAAPVVSLFLDFDGTLAPIVKQPGDATLDGAVRECIAGLSHNPRIVIGVISGRAIQDVAARVAIEGIVYAGNHGLEIIGSNFRFVEPTALSAKAELKKLSSELTLRLRQFPGAEVEYKGLTATVHYGQAGNQTIRAIRDTIRDAIGGCASSLQVRGGYESIEIIPCTNWNKGNAVLWINRRFGIAMRRSIYIGDDATDEDAFRVLPEGVTIKVGTSTRTYARYLLKSPDEVQEILCWFASLVEGRR